MPKAFKFLIIASLVISPALLDIPKAAAGYAAWNYSVTGCERDPADYNQCQTDANGNIITRTEVVANFNANTYKDVFSPGESVTVTIAGRSGAGGENADFFNAFCLFNCDGPPHIGVAVHDPVSGAIMIACDGGGSTSCTGTLTAPTAPGTYYIPLDGCYENASQCGFSSIPITVGGTPSVQLYFSLLRSMLLNSKDKIKSNII